jgi:hypothetical protein
MAALDQAVLQLVQSCNLPPLPAEYEKTTWPFTQIVQVR